MAFLCPIAKFFFNSNFTFLLKTFENAITFFCKILLYIRIIHIWAYLFLRSIDISKNWKLGGNSKIGTEWGDEMGSPMTLLSTLFTSIFHCHFWLNSNNIPKKGVLGQPIGLLDLSIWYIFSSNIVVIELITQLIVQNLLNNYKTSPLTWLPYTVSQKSLVQEMLFRFKAMWGMQRFLLIKMYSNVYNEYNNPPFLSSIFI